jgi:hypothetical protein
MGISIHDNPDEDKYKAQGVIDAEKEGIQTGPSIHANAFNRIQYQNFLCSSLFMIGKDFDSVVTETEKGISLCASFKYEPLLPEIAKMLSEFKGIKMKATAKKLNTNALDLKEKEQEEKEAGDPKGAITKNSNFSASAALATFVLTGGLVYATLMGVKKLRNN